MRKSENRERLAVLLAAGETVAGAAREMDVPTPTAYRWSRQPDVVSRVKELQNEATSRSVNLLKKTLENSVRVLVEIMEDAGTPPSVRVSAAGKLLDSSLKSIEIADVLARLEEVERRLEEEAE